MAQVIKNVDDTFTVTLTAKEHKVLNRWGNEQVPPRPRAKQIEEVISAFLLNKANDYRRLDGPQLQDKYDALDPTKQAQVDALLNGA